MDTDSIKDSIRNYQKSNREIESIVKNLVRTCCSSLDELVREVQNTVQDMQNPITDEELDFFILNLPIQMYFANEQLELLGLSEDLAKQEKTKKYNEAYSQESGTIADKKNYAESSIRKQQVVVSIYNRASKQIKTKIDIATELLQSLKKVSSRHMAERNIEMSGYKRIQED